MNYYLATIQFIEGKKSFHKNELENAINQLQKSVELDPLNQHAWFYYAEASRLTGKFKNATVSYKRCLKLNPYYGRAITQLKRIAEMKQKP